MTLELVAPASVGLTEPDAPAVVLPPALDPARPPSVGENGERLREPDVPWVDAYRDLPLPGRDAIVVRDEVATRLTRAASALPQGFGLLVLDGWRSPDFQRSLLEYYRNLHPDLGEGYVSDPEGSLVAPHTTGGAVDLTLTWDGVPLALGTDFDAFTDQARVDALEVAPSVERGLRRLLAAALRGAGFVPYPLEWWHWSYGEQWWAAGTGAEVTCYGPLSRRRPAR